MSDLDCQDFSGVLEIIAIKLWSDPYVIRLAQSAYFKIPLRLPLRAMNLNVIKEDVHTLYPHVVALLCHIKMLHVGT